MDEKQILLYEINPFGVPRVHSEGENKQLLTGSNPGTTQTLTPGQQVTLIDVIADQRVARNLVVTLFGSGAARDKQLYDASVAILQWGAGGAGLQQVEIDLITGLTIGISCQRLRIDARNDSPVGGVSIVAGATAAYGSPSGHPSQYPTRTLGPTNINGAATVVFPVPQFARDVNVLRDAGQAYTAAWLNRAAQTLGLYALAANSDNKLVRPNGAVNLSILNSGAAGLFTPVFGLAI